MKTLLDDRRRLLPVLVTALVIAVGSVLVITLTGDESGGGSASAPAPSGPATGGSGKTVEVKIDDFKFMPESISVRAGSKLAFVNDDTAAHTATAPGDGFDRGETKTVEITEPGTTSYICDFHPFMKGTVEVK